MPAESTRTTDSPAALEANKPAAATKKRRQRRDTTGNQSSASTAEPATSTSPSHHPTVYHQPYPAGPTFIMNPPSYPLNGGSPYAQQGPPHPPYHPQAGGSPPPPHPPAHYGYMAQPYTQGFTYQYPVMMYSATPSMQPVEHSQSPAPPEQHTSTAGSKRKRKGPPKKGESDEDAGPSGPEPTRPQAAAVDMKKRTKTQRACDSCRSRKIRCDILADSEPPICQHCKQYGFDCTYYLPITETRFKKKKIEEEPTDKDSGKTSDHKSKEIGVYGPTSAAHLLHSQATISARIYEGYDQRYHHTYEVTQNGDGLIQVQKQAPQTNAPPPKPIDIHVERDVVEQLINAYFTEVAPILPVITKQEFLSYEKPPPILLYSICLIAATRREAPSNVFESLRFAVNNLIKTEDVMSTASFTNVQALLILCMGADCHSPHVANALSALWIRAGTAIRMAQDLGLHRAEAVKENIEARRRLWGACVITDRWTSLAYGHPFMIDIQDCDARLPSSGDPNDLYMDELLRLSVILGRVMKSIYSPSGLAQTTDEMLYALLHDLEEWQNRLPDNLKFMGPYNTSRNAGLLHVLYVCVTIIFWRVFMRISYSCPQHIKFGLTVEQWSKLVKLTGETIDWLDANEHMYDVWLLVAYACTACALVQYHTWARRTDEEACARLRKLRDCVGRWESSFSSENMSARRKTAEIITLLYEATQGQRYPNERPVLNPTGGVQGKPPLELDYKKDPSRPGGGVFVARSKRDGDLNDLPEGTVITSSDEESEGETLGNAVSPVYQYNNDRNRASLLSSLATPSSFAPPMAQQHPDQAHHQPEAAPSMVNFTPLANKGGNMNPAMNATSGPRNQVINMLDVPQPSGSLADVAMADSGYLEGIPGGMFDWGQWESFFSRIHGNPADMSALQQHQRQQMEQHRRQQHPGQK